ncbi:hypothetical protein WDD9_001083 [Paenibacillus melissococcoides]|nr:MULTISPECIES: hypothetical protein [Paenibacillus]MEB9897445.1 hypothetical protein [Bacillus cereus]GIO77631.1 hypothetical protein J6TS7_12410 [Paenibacillus dendritiformis]CAH8703465.1 hypothetical protein HTL2_000123 [Paenibacillus melissococcoides]CAH8705880.1 hypothetical protein WDD9_001083 [Paenibacillus melissococcoides]
MSCPDGGEGEPVEADGVIVSVADAGRASRRQEIAFVSAGMEGTAIHGEASRAAGKIRNEWLFSVWMSPVYPTGRSNSSILNK